MASPVDGYGGEGSVSNWGSISDRPAWRRRGAGGVGIHFSIPAHRSTLSMPFCEQAGSYSRARAGFLILPPARPDALLAMPVQSGQGFVQTAHVKLNPDRARIRIRPNSQCVHLLVLENLADSVALVSLWE